MSLHVSPWSDVEGALAYELDELWKAHNAKNTSLSLERAELKELRMMLGERLHAAKEQLVGAGRGGKWSEFLRWVKIPESSPDRYVEVWKSSQLSKSIKLLGEELSEPSTEVIAALVKKLKPQVLRTLTTPASISIFMADLAVALSPVDTVD